MKRKIYLSLLACMFCAIAWSQTRQVTGRVTSDSTNQGISGVSVTVKGGAGGTSTNESGAYTINIPDRNNVVLVFSAIGYTTREIEVGSRNSVSLELITSSGTMDVVVIGYQTVRRRDLLASVSSVSARDLKDIPINSAAEALNGRLAGVTATTSEGSPDAEVRIRVRGGMSINGDNSPLYVIDGVVVESGLSTISPQDIQSIDVLKDAAATAIYGARGANGVIVITTKSGRPGRTIIGYNGFVGIKKLATKLDVMSPYQFVLYQAERSRSVSAADSTAFVDRFGPWDSLRFYNNAPVIDWQEEVLGRTGFMQTHNVTASGGNNKATFNFGYTHNDDKAIVLNSRYIRDLFNIKGDYRITSKLKIGVGGRYTNQHVEGAGVSSDRGSTYNRLRNAVRYRPFKADSVDLTDPDPLADPNVGNNLNLHNPITLADAEYRKRSTIAYNVTANISYNITKNLNFRSTFGYDNNEQVDRQFFDSIAPLSILQGARKPIAILDTITRKTFTNSNVLTYSLKGLRGKHDLDIMVGEETYDLRTEIEQNQFRDFPTFTSRNQAFKETTLGIPFTGYPKFGKSRSTIFSLFGRVNYAYRDKYLFSFSMRGDASSKFIPGRQWGYFPAASLGWRVKKEKFMENVDVISDMKFRVSYGKIGNNRIRDYLFLTTFSQDGRYYYGINNQALFAYYSSALVNEKLKWESTVNRNIGVDISFARRFDLSVEYYNNTSSDLLLDVQINPTFGYSQQLQNVGKTSNKGVEIQLNSTIVRNRQLNWTANFNISFNKNEVEQLGPNQVQFFPGASWGVSGQPTDYIVRIGEPVGSMYGLVNDGFYTTNDFIYINGIYHLKPGIANNSAIIGTVAPGMIKFKDLNGDGLVDLNNDRTIIGNANPKFTGGLNQQVTFKQWDASLFMNFSYGNDVYNANKIEFTNSYSGNSNMLAMMEDRWITVTPTGQTAQWTVTNPVSGQPPLAAGIPLEQLAALNANAKIWQPIRSTGAFYPHSWAIEDGSFLRINNLTVGYSMPVRSISGLKMTKLRFYVTANNLAILTNYTGYDPEVSVRNNPLTPGLDYSAYPKSRSFIFGINATF